MYILGISERGHNPAACLMQDGKLISFVEEERFTRVKGSPNSYPIQASIFCIEHAGIRLSDIDCIAVGWNLSKYEGYMQSFYKSLSNSYVKDKTTLLTEQLLLERFRKERVEHAIQEGFFRHGCKDALPEIEYIDHHLAHCASTFFSSPFSDALILTIDGAGEDIATGIWAGRELDIELIDSYQLPNSLGWFYSAITEYLGFTPNQHEGKVMGLASYGKENPKVREVLNRVLTMSKGRYQVDPRYLFFGKHTYGIRFTDQLVGELGLPRNMGEPLTELHKDVAYVAQDILETVVLAIIRNYALKSNFANLCLAGGVAMNCRLNGAISSVQEIENIYIPPMCNDAGTALGAAMISCLKRGIDPRSTMSHAYWGPSYSNEEVEKRLKLAKVSYNGVDEPGLAAAEFLSDGKIVGWFQGRAEVGARALGARSILANPSLHDIKDTLNSLVKFREPWRPFAAAVLEEDSELIFGRSIQSPFMMVTFDVQPNSREYLRSAIHVDGTTRPQTVSSEDVYSKYRNVLEHFRSNTSIPAILNTSFNVRGEPIVCSPEDALRCFYSTGLDVLIVENFVIEK